MIPLTNGSVSSRQAGGDQHSRKPLAELSGPLFRTRSAESAFSLLLEHSPQTLSRWQRSSVAAFCVVAWHAFIDTVWHG